MILFDVVLDAALGMEEGLSELLRNTMKACAAEPGRRSGPFSPPCQRLEVS
jgi:hypothetical protein